MPNELPSTPKRHRDALTIVDQGACNPSGIAYSIHEACKEARDEGVVPSRDAAVRLMGLQLSNVLELGDSLEPGEFRRLRDACRAAAA